MEQSHCFGANTFRSICLLQLVYQSYLISVSHTGAGFILSTEELVLVTYDQPLSRLLSCWILALSCVSCERETTQELWGTAASLSSVNPQWLWHDVAPRLEVHSSYLTMARGGQSIPQELVQGWLLCPTARVQKSGVSGEEMWASVSLFISFFYGK